MTSRRFRPGHAICSWRTALAVALTWSIAASGGAETTITLGAADTTLRGGTYQDTNFGTTHLVTRSSDTSTWIRRALFKFDTHTTIPAGATINAAALTLTVRGGNSESRTLTAYAEPYPFQEGEATWIRRKSAHKWETPGGDTAGRYATAPVTGTPGSKVSFDLTKLVQAVVNGTFGSRYTRALLVDKGGSSRGSYKEYFSSEASRSSVRPKLVVTYGGEVTTSSTAESTASTSTSTTGGGSSIILRADDTTLRGGTYRDKNFGTSRLVTRASGNATWIRRALLKFDTHRTMPAGVKINSATLTFTVRGGNGESRTLTAFAEPYPFQELEATWTRRKATHKWKTPGGDTAGSYATAKVTGTPGSTVSFDLTTLVQDVVNGKFGSRYTRVLLIDKGGSSRGSYKEYYSNEAADPSVRPKLVVTYGGTSTSTSTSSSSTSTTDSSTSTSTSSSGSTTTLRVLQWNLHHGVGTDGKYDLNRIADWMVKLNPHIMSLNEVERYTSFGNEDQPARYKALLKQKTGKTWYSYFVRDWGGTGNGQGHLILSRIPLDSTSEHSIYRGRAIARAAITFNGRTVNLFSAHWDYQRSHTSQRVAQAKDTVAAASNFAQQRIIAGDLNSLPSEQSIDVMNLTYYDAWAKGKKQGIAVSYPGNEAGNTRNSRIDYIFFSKTAGALVLKQVQVPDTRDSDGDRPSDHRPLLATFEVK